MGTGVFAATLFENTNNQTQNDGSMERAALKVHTATKKHLRTGGITSKAGEEEKEAEEEGGEGERRERKSRESTKAIGTPRTRETALPEHLEASGQDGTNDSVGERPKPGNILERCCCGPALEG